ncbi:hypothetical protein B0H99_101148 [Planomicrobium soli]|uniref:Uncharacterized protein n=1 Tax=Planomicrobium soli TaxID=1176648 RepID=A0A2P8H6Q8_9BACL|nr:hypothetical protein [Planomicrobium soli]PSL41902.1 hypothetical protein B0H99_101148 [Planomicrobium soli]
MENTLYRLIMSNENLSAKEKETFIDFLDYEEALSSYNKTIKSKTSGDEPAESVKESFLLVRDDYESNMSGQWHWCNLKSEKGDVFAMRIEPIQFFEAEYFASKDIETRYKAIYGTKGNSKNFFTRLFRWKK